MVLPKSKGKGSKLKTTTKFLIVVGTMCILCFGTVIILQNEAMLSSNLNGSDEASSIIDLNFLDTKKAEGTSATTATTGTAATTTDSVSIESVAISQEKNDLIKSRRKSILSKCEKEASTVVVKNLEADFFTSIPTSKSIPKQAPKPSFKRCKNVVLDFGANVGDTAGHLIDAGLPHCHDLKSDQLPRLMLGDRKLEPGRWNMVTKFLKQMMDATKHYPEDYCYYGIEGNPVFTERLQGIEDFIAAIEPSPLAHASFLTESVGAGEYGMTKLYLDTVNEKENFWGSSIMAGHQDVKKSAEGGEVKAHPVMGYTITKLMDMILLGMKADATEEEKKGAHLLLKVDIEGGEYALTKEVFESGALCKFVEMGNTVDVVIETHSQRVTGPNPLIRQFGGWRKHMEECGVTFRGLQAWWA